MAPLGEVVRRRFPVRGCVGRSRAGPGRRSDARRGRSTSLVATRDVASDAGVSRRGAEERSTQPCVRDWSGRADGMRSMRSRSAVPAGSTAGSSGSVSTVRVPSSRALAQSVQAAVRRSGIAVEDRPYRPHLTVARAATPSDLRPYVEALRGYSGPAWPVRSYTLVRSQLGQGPGRSALHTVLETWPLTGPTTHG